MLLVLNILFTKDCFSQINDTSESSKPEKVCEPKDIRDLLRRKNKKAKPPKRTSLLLLPNISANPTNGFLLGVGGNLTTFFGPRETTRISFIGFSAAVTTKQQFLSFIKTNIYTKNNKFFLQGDLRYYHYNLPTYGLGTNAPVDSVEYNGGWIWQGAEAEESGGSYPMLYDYLKFHEIVNMKFANNLYAGIGYQLDYFWNIKDEIWETDSSALTPHQGYSNENNFETGDYMLSGLSLNMMYDSRDNQINPYKGYYANINYRINQTWLGSDQNSTSLWLEFRTYVGLSKKKARHLIAFWVFGDFQITGVRPYLTLMALAEDQKARSGRGYVGGRFRGDDYVSGEVEYRFPISQCSEILGGVFFINATTASNRLTNVNLFEYVKPAIGLGLRVMINKTTRLNLNLDFAIGVDSKGFYFSGTETF